MDDELLSELLAYLRTAPDRLCPSCGRERIDPKSPHGWCPRCTGRHERALARKREWFNKTYGADADPTVKAAAIRKRDERAAEGN